MVLTVVCEGGAAPRLHNQTCCLLFYVGRGVGLGTESSDGACSTHAGFACVSAAFCFWHDDAIHTRI